MQKDLSKRGSIPGLTVPVNNNAFITSTFFKISWCFFSLSFLLLFFLSHLNLSYAIQNLIYLAPSPLCAHQHCLMSSLKLSGQLSGTGSCRLLLPTPQMIAEESTSLQGTSPVSISHSTTPNDLQRGVEHIFCQTGQNASAAISRDG